MSSGVKGPSAPARRTFAELADEVCVGAGLDLSDLRSRDLGSAFKTYVRQAAGVSVRARRDAYSPVLDVRPASACSCECLPCNQHERVFFEPAEWRKLQEVLGQHCVKETPRLRSWFFADPTCQSLPTGYEDEVVAPILVPSEHQDLVRALLQRACNQVRPGAYPDVCVTGPARPRPTLTPEKARTWLNRQKRKLRAAAAVLGREAVLQVLDGARPRRGR